MHGERDLKVYDLTLRICVVCIVAQHFVSLIWDSICHTGHKIELT